MPEPGRPDVIGVLGKYIIPDSTDQMYFSHSNSICVNDQNVHTSGYKLHEDRAFCFCGILL